MIVDIRTYNIVPRKMAEYLTLFEEHALPVQRRHIGDPLAYFQTIHGALNQVVHIWGFDSLPTWNRSAPPATPTPPGRTTSGGRKASC